MMLPPSPWAPLALFLFFPRLALGSGAQVAVNTPYAFEAPGPNWPAATADLSDAAWASKAQPVLFATWPTDAQGIPQVCDAGGSTVLKDTAKGWPGLCLGLKLLAAAEDPDACRKSCEQNPDCPVWQYIAAEGCYQGVGHHCLTRDNGQDAVVVQSAQRLQHGDVRVLKDMRGFYLSGLRNLGVQHAGNTSDGVEHCRITCISDIYCQFWQYGGDGCSVEDKDNRAEAPLTTVTALTPSFSTDASTIMAGQYIQHVCMAAGTAPRGAAAVATEQAGGVSSFLSSTTGVAILGTLALLGVGGLLAYCLFCQGGDKCKRAKKHRALKLTSPKEAAQPLEAPVEVPFTGVATYMPVPTVPMAQGYVPQVQGYQQMYSQAPPMPMYPNNGSYPGVVMR